MRVVIGEDSLLLREGIARVLEASGMDVVALAGDFDSLLAAVEAERPDAAVVDIRMPPTHTDEGLRAARLFLSDRAVERHVTAIFTKLALTATPENHRRVLAVLTYLRA